MDTALEKRMVEALERSATANERLIELATEERDSGDAMLGPAACPHCGRLDPVIRNEGGEGDFSDFTLVAVCMSCGKMFIARPQGWLTYRDQRDFKAATEEGRT